MNRQQRRRQAKQLGGFRKTPRVSGGWSVVKIHADGQEEIVHANVPEHQIYELGDQVRLTLEPGQQVTLRGPLEFDFD